MCSIWGGFLSLASILDFQHCTDEAQKAETVLSAVSYIYIYIFSLPRFSRMTPLKVYINLSYSTWLSSAVDWLKNVFRLAVLK